LIVPVEFEAFWTMVLKAQADDAKVSETQGTIAANSKLNQQTAKPTPQAAPPASDLRDHLKTGQRGSPQNRPMEPDPEQGSYTVPAAIWQEIC
jgi:hypothetical protein